MEWSKLKNIVLIILAATNLGLLIFVVRRDLQNDRFQTQARTEAIQFLEDRGVTVAEDQLPEETSLLPMLAERDLEREAVLAAQLLEGAVRVEDRGAGVYRYFNDRGSIQFHSDGAFSGQLAPGAYPVGENEEEGCLALLARLDFAGELLEVEANAETSRLTFRQLWEELPLFSQQVTLELKDGCATALIAGRRLIGTPVEDPERETITVPTALVSLLNGINALGDVCSRVDTIDRGYVGSVSLSGPMSLTPTWLVVTDTGAYQMDMVSGELTRVS